MQPIQIIGIKQLDDMEIDTINKLANEYYDKIAKTLRRETSVKVHVKTHRTKGKRKKYDVSVRIKNPKVSFQSTDTTDWDLARTLHKAFNDIQRGIRHRLRSDTSYRKSYE